MRRPWIARHVSRDGRLIHENRRFWTRWGAERYRYNIYNCHPLLPKEPITFTIVVMKDLKP